jgi:thiol:disulfide interchange protein DsbA
MRVLPLLALLSAALLTAPAALAQAAPVEGRQYLEVPFPIASQAPTGKVEVVELFLYTCPHCFDFEPLVSKWNKTKAAHVAFRQVPAVFEMAPGVLNPQHELLARVYYTAEALGMLEKLHPRFFDVIHVDKRKPYSDALVREFFVANGADGAQFDATFRSFGISAKVKQAAELSKQSGATGVPAMVVAGKYQTGPGMTGGFEGLTAVVNHLAAREAKPVK